MKLNARELRDIDENEVKIKLKHIKRRPIYFILENIYDTYNIGGLFRLADALAIEKIYLCGETEIPPNSRIKKASIGTYKVVPWVYKKSATEAIKELRDSRPANAGRQARMVRIIAVEQAKNSIRFGIGRFNIEEEINYTINRVVETVEKLRAIAPTHSKY